MTSAEKITRLKAALAAAEAVQAEIERRNNGDISPFRVAQRAPLLHRAIIEVRDTRTKISDAEAAAIEVSIDIDVVARLDRNAARLDQAIKKNALIDLAMESLTVVLNAVAEVRTTLS